MTQDRGSRLIDTTTLTDQLAPTLAEWLPQQRWFAGKGRGLRVESVVSVGTLTVEPHWSAVLLVTVAYNDGVRETFNVPVSVHTEAAEELAHALIGQPVGGDDSDSYVYDGLHDKAVTNAWLQLLADTASTTASNAGIEAALGPNVEVSELPLGQSSLVMTAEQSNTSLVYGDVAILKVFRRVEHGRNPDIEVHAALGSQHATQVARLLGSLSARWTDGGDTAVDQASAATSAESAIGDIAMLQEFLRSATDGWSLAQISVRDLFAEADLHADEVGGDFAAESYRLGVATAETHVALAAALPTSTHSNADLRDVAAAMRGRLDAAAADIPELTPFVPALVAIFDGLATLTDAVPTQRIHADLHLGQVLRTSNRWVVIDFEGEPSKPIAERRSLDSPLRDVAGMLRSFHYAARHHLVAQSGHSQLAYRADEWVARNSDAYCAGYASVGDVDPRAYAVLLSAYEADKAVYEAVYEARNRPSWLVIPLHAINRIAAGPRA